jgi:hypothetical protein
MAGAHCSVLKNKEGQERERGKRGEEREREERLGSRHRLMTGADLFLLNAHTCSLRCTPFLKQNQREGQKKEEKKKD